MQKNVSAASSPPGSTLPGGVEPSVIPPSSGSAPRFQGRGMLLDDALYIERAADKELIDALARREHCHVLAPRQVGKSNLRIRAAEALRRQGVRCVSVDLTAIGSNVSEDEWYFGVARLIARRLKLEIDVEAFWKRNERLSLPQRWSELLRVAVLEHTTEPVVLFLDEIDVTLALSFSRDDFFRTLQSIQNGRGDDPAWKRLTFCLMGVASPTDLVENLKLTPFNKSKPIQLEDFTRTEVERAREGLEAAGGSSMALLDAVFAWTDGHPALTQQLCERLVLDAGPGSEAERVDKLVEEMYLRRGRTDDPILADVDRRFTGTDSATLLTSKMLKPYQRLLAGEKVPARSGDRLHLGLRLAGLVAERRDEAGAAWIRPRNRIFRTVFDEQWVNEQLRARVYADPLTRWLQEDKDDAYVLRGEHLSEALEWSKGREDVTPEEMEFLLAGQNAATRDQERRQEEQMARERLDAALASTHAKYRWLKLFSACAVVFLLTVVVLTWATAVARRGEAKVVEEQKRSLEKERIAVDEARTQVESFLKAAQWQKEEADERKTTADKKAREAQLKADAAWQAAADAERKAAQAGASVTLATQQRKAAQELAKEARAAEQEATKARNEASLAKVAAEARAKNAQDAAELGKKEVNSLKDKLNEALAAAAKSAEEAERATRRAEEARQKANEAQRAAERALLECQTTQRWATPPGQPRAPSLIPVRPEIGPYD